jgi:hypothetical protein
MRQRRRRITIVLLNVSEIKESWWLYLMGLGVALFIISGSLYFVLSAVKKSKELQMPKEVIKRTIISSISFSILPSIGIFIGVITMAGLLGIPLPWIRLSVIGALHYELMAASIAAEGITLMTLTTQNFVTIAFVMTISILWGPIFTLLFFKKYQQKVINKAATGSSGGFGKILFDAFFIGLILAFFGDAFSKIFQFNIRLVVDGAYVLDESGKPIVDNLPTFVPVIVFFSALFASLVFDLLIKKFQLKWLENFQLAFSMIIGMAVAVFLGMGGIV